MGNSKYEASEVKKFFKFLMVSFELEKTEWDSYTTPDSLKGTIGRKDEKAVKSFQ